MSAQAMLREGCRRVVGSGTDIDIWEDEWLPDPPYRIQSARPTDSSCHMVAELINHDTMQWRLDLLVEIFSEV